MTVLVCGEALYDVFVAEATATGFALDARIGGSALNVAAGLARLGRDVALLTGVSTDRLGERLAGFMRSEGVSTRALKRVDAPSTLALIGTRADGSAVYRFYAQGAADQLVEPDDVPPLDDVEALVFGCFSLLTRPTGDTFLDLAGRAGDRLVVLDPNVRLNVEPEAAVWRDRVDAFARHADLVKVSREDVAAVWGMPNDDVAQHWLGLGAAGVIVTDGPDGSTLFSPRLRLHVPSVPTAVVDTVGAGDSFLAATMTALAELGRASRAGLEALTEAEAGRVLSFASRAAAMTCARRGADLPRRAELPAV